MSPQLLMDRAAALGTAAQLSLADLPGAIAPVYAGGAAAAGQLPPPPQLPAPGQGPPYEADIPPDALIGTLGALRALLGREGFARLLYYVRLGTIGAATVNNAALWASGWLLDPVRWLYERGLRVVIPGAPPEPIRGLFTPNVSEALQSIDTSLFGGSLPGLIAYLAQHSDRLLSEYLAEPQVENLPALPLPSADP